MHGLECYSAVPMSSGKSSKKGSLPCFFLKSLIQPLRSPKSGPAIGEDADLVAVGGAAGDKLQ